MDGAANPAVNEVVKGHANPTERPDSSEAGEYYFTYIDQVKAGDIRDVLESQGAEALGFLREIAEDRTLERYAPGKWTVREVLSHVNDTERVFAFRALWFARGVEAPLPGFDQDVAMAGADANSRSWASLVDEFSAVRGATAALFRNLPADAWGRKGVASERVVSVRALAFITAGHVEHHLRILRERYRLGETT